ncbi:MAG TPA: hypothetical protein VKR06_36875 [Ktedonosporobacter sp.]|nr:hypothetical protein [Ktedonosporobacter sp.]
MRAITLRALLGLLGAESGSLSAACPQPCPGIGEECQVLVGLSEGTIIVAVVGGHDSGRIYLSGERVLSFLGTKDLEWSYKREIDGTKLDEELPREAH